jgi:hypothetical protein
MMFSKAKSQNSVLEILKFFRILGLCFFAACGGPYSQGKFSITGERIYKRDTTAPLVTTLLPAPLANDVSIDQNLAMTFDDSITLNSVLASIPSIYIRLASDDSVVFVYALEDSEISISGKSLIINPGTDLSYSTDYYVEVANAIVKNTRDLYSEGISGSTAWSFRTEASPTGSLVIGSISGDTDETGTTATFSVRLGSVPSSDVVIDVSSSNLGEGTVSPLVLTFTSSNWSTDQTVTVTGVNDALVDGNISYDINLIIDDVASDNSYDAVADAAISVTNSDDDMASLMVSSISGSTNESGTTASFTVRLATQPLSDVVIDISSGNTGEGTVDSSSLTFTNANWDTDQTVTVTGIDDVVIDGDNTYLITVSVNDISSDDTYDNISDSFVFITNHDDDATPSFIIGAISGNTDETGTTATFSVRLGSAPSSDVVVDVSSSDLGEGTVSPLVLTFTSSDWSTDQTVTVTGVDDALDDGDVSYDVNLVIDDIASDSSYDGILDGAISVTNVDNDVVGSSEIILSASDGAAGDQFGYSVALDGASALVGARNKNINQGAAYLYRYNPSTYTWDEEILTASDGASNNAFGTSVALDGNTALVGAHGKNFGQGAAYLYRYNPTAHVWDEDILTASNGASSNFFGVSVALDGNSALVGAFGTNSNQGAAYLYRYNPATYSWDEEILSASDGASNDFFGYFVALSGNTALVGAHGKNSDEGAAYLYRYNPATHAWNEEILTASDGAASDVFGYGVALSGNTALVGAHAKNSGQGAAYLYRYNPTTHAWDEEILTASDGSITDSFGVSVALSGATALVGAYSKNSNQGAAYLYRHNPTTHAWVEEVLTASNGAGNDQFGFSVALSGNTALVGAYGKNSNQGAAYLLQLTPPVEIIETKLIASDATANNFFGSSVAIDGNTAIVGARGKNFGRGVAYLYRYNPATYTWDEAILSASDGANGDNFGTSVAIDGDTAIVGAPSKNASQGAAYLYRYNPASYTWEQEILTASDGLPGDKFGISVALSGNFALVGASLKNSGQGGAYLYSYNPATHLWAEEIFTALDGSSNDYYGASVAIDGNSALVGAYGKNSSQGAVYLYRLDPSIHYWHEGILTASDGVSGDEFGISVAIDGNSALVGAYRKNSTIGAVYLYRYNSGTYAWDEEIITASDGVSGDGFGLSVAIDGNTALVGAQGKNSAQGAAYLLLYNSATHNWDEEILNASEGALGDRFGGSVALSENTALVGASFKNTSTGAVYFYQRGTAPIIVSAISRSTDESGRAATFAVKLGVAPSSNVVLDVTSGDTGEGTVSASSLTFTSANWNTYQTITVTGIDDSLVDRDITYNITVAVNDAASDNSFDAISDSLVSVTNKDDDSASLVISSISGDTNESGTTSTFTVSLGAAPVADVVIDVSSSDLSEGTITPLVLTFTASDWNTDQTVTVTGVDDTLNDGDSVYFVNLSVDAVSSDDGYDGLVSSSVLVINTDDETASETILVASDGATGDVYGRSVAISGNSAVVGAIAKNSDTGAAYLYRYNPATYNWDEEILTASDGAGGDQFGISVAIEGNSVLVGASGKNSSQGAAYLYRYNPTTHVWNEEILTASDGSNFNFFGISVAVDGNDALVGASFASSGIGAAYLYRYEILSDTWDEEIFTASDGSSSDEFGCSVDIDGNTVIVGANAKNLNSGGAYLYSYNSSTHSWYERILTASDSGLSDKFGTSVAINGDIALVGASGRNSNQGAAYLYRYNSATFNWDEEILTASGAAAPDLFGYTVDLDGNTAVIGSYVKNSAAGAIYLYRYNPSTHNWDEEILVASDGMGSDYFGWSVSISGNNAIVGSWGKNSAQGAAYLLHLDPPPSLDNETIISASGGATNDFFGFSADISNNSAIVGAYGKSSSTGAAYLYRYNPDTYTWDEEILTASDGSANHNFGYSVAIDGNTALVGAWGKSSNRGAAYLYRYNPVTHVWNEEILTASDGANGHRFGSSVALDGNTALVGAYRKNSITGAAYLYRYNPVTYAWNEVILTASNAISGDYFGYSVAIDGNTALVGAYGKNSFQGMAYLYRYNSANHTWVEEMLSSNIVGSGDYFGHSVAIDGNTALVGAYGKNSQAGAAFVYRYDPALYTWSEEILTASDGQSLDRFGYSVSISGNSALVGAYDKNGSTGAAYLYHYNPTTYNWDEEILTASDGVANDNFGMSVAISGNTALSGAYFKNNAQGGVYIYR